VKPQVLMFRRPEIHARESSDGTAYARERAMMQNSTRTRTLLPALGIALFVAMVVAAIAHHRSSEKARFASDIHRIESQVPRFAIETPGSAAGQSDTAAWRAYCEHARVTLIEEARAAAAQ
jgi:hypothetical protein